MERLDSRTKTRSSVNPRLVLREQHGVRPGGAASRSARHGSDGGKPGSVVLERHSLPDSPPVRRWVATHPPTSLAGVQRVRRNRDCALPTRVAWARGARRRRDVDATLPALLSSRRRGGGGWGGRPLETDDRYRTRRAIDTEGSQSAVQSTAALDCTYPSISVSEPSGPALPT